MAWEKVRLGDVCVSIADGDHLPPPKADCGIPFVTISNITSANQFDFTNTMFVPQEYYDSLDEKRKPKVNDILYSVVGSFGKPVFIKDDSPFVFQRHIAILRPDESKIYSRYLYYKMLSNDFYMMADAVAVGAAQRTVSLTALRNMEINIPNKETQKRIADILSAYDDLIENNQKQIKLLEEAAQRLYKQRFIDLKFPGHETTKIVDGLPEGWKKRIISEVCETIGGGTPSTSKQEYYHNGKIPWATPTDLTKNDSLVLLDTEKKITEEGLKHSSAKLLPCNSILMTSRASIGYFAICDFPVCTNQGFISCIPYNSDMFYYLLFNLMCRVDEIKGKATGSTFLEITKREFRNMEIVEPSESLLKNFSKIIEPIVNKIRTVKKEIVGLTQSRDRLLPKLMNNEIEV